MAYPLLFDHSEQSCLVLLSWNKISYMKLQNLKIFKTTKDMFYKHFDFFLRIDRAIVGLREPCPFIWSRHGMGERKFVQTVLVTWTRWPPCPYMGKKP